MYAFFTARIVVLLFLSNVCMRVCVCVCVLGGGGVGRTYTIVIYERLLILTVKCITRLFDDTAMVGREIQEVGGECVKVISLERV